LLLAPAAVHPESEATRNPRIPSQSQIEDLQSGLAIAKSSPPRPLAPLAPELIMAFEGWEPSPYDDPSGYCTVGFGHLLKKSRCATIDLSKYSRPLTKQQGAELLEADSRTARASVQRLVRRDLKDHEFGALSSFVFNVGKGQFSESALLRLLSEGHFAAASNEFGKWIVSKKRVLPGLISRRACEAALFRNQLKPNAGGEFVRGDCESLGAAPLSGTLIDVDTGKEIQSSEAK
jgi:lysozyme